MTLPSLQKPKGFDNENHLSLPTNKYSILSNAYVIQHHVANQ